MDSFDLDTIEAPRTINATCTNCGKVESFEVNPSGFYRWREEGVLIQRAMPDLTPDQREILVSGVCGTCFDNMFGEDES